VTLAPLSGSFRPGGPTTPQPVEGSGSGHAEPYHLQFLTAEERSTAVLMGFYQDARLELENFIRNTGDLSVSDATYYRKLLDETNRIASEANGKGVEWTSRTIDDAYSAGWRQNSSVVVPRGAIEALSRQTTSLITQTSLGIQQSVRQAIAQGILQGLPADQVRARIIATGLTNIPHWPSVEYRAGVIARTETMTAYNAGNLSAIRENGARFAEWIASPDEAVCPVCAPRNGKIYRLDAGSAGPTRRIPPAITAAQPSNWHVSKPWERSKADFEAGAVAGFRYVPSTDVGKMFGIGPVLAQAKNEAIEVYDRFFEQSEASRAMTLYHEAGHFSMRSVEGGPAKLLEQYKTASGSYDIPWYSGQGQPLAGGNVQPARLEEVVADVYADMVFGDNRKERVADMDPSSSYSKGRADVYRQVHAAATGIGLDPTDRWRSRSGALLPGSGENFLNSPDDPGRIEGPVGADSDGTDPYPHALPMPRCPAHPRCRCTFRAVYRGPDGKVLGTPNAQAPELPKDAMGGSDKPIMPAAKGDFEQAIAKLNREAAGGGKMTPALLKTLGNLDDDQIRALKAIGGISNETRQLWRSFGRFSEDEIRAIAGIGKTNSLGHTTMGNVLQARYGVTFGKITGWNAELRIVTLRALERLRAMNPAFVVDSKYLHTIGDRPPGAKKFDSNTIARAFASGHVEGNMKLWNTFTPTGGRKLRAGDIDAAEEVILHEYAHTVHNRFGLHDLALNSPARIGSRINAYTAVEAVDKAWHQEYQSIRSASKGVAPDEGALTKLREQLAKYEAYRDDPTRAGIRSYNESIIERTQRQIAETEAALKGHSDHEWYPTDYAMTSYGEDFAESVMLYFLNPARLKKYSPQRYAFVRDKVFAGKEPD
jgi:SPP1 gp7 family putative phage head morphogenesis protein